LVTSVWQKIVYATRKFWNEKIEKLSFLKFELKFFVFEFWKKIGHTTIGKLKKLKKIGFEIWKILTIPQEGNEKNWNMPQKFEMK
jgi:hypothetical protein